MGFEPNPQLNLRLFKHKNNKKLLKIYNNKFVKINNFSY